MLRAAVSDEHSGVASTRILLTKDDGVGAVVPATVTEGAVTADLELTGGAGVYEACVEATDWADNVATSDCSFVVVYDEGGGFVTGGGWIESPPSALRSDPALGGRASFGFVSRYKAGTTVPSGVTEFQFSAGTFDFQSQEYSWLVVSGRRAQFKGRGKINGEGSYGFLLTAIDEALVPDRIRIKIWAIDTGAVVYDNQVGAGDSATPTTQLAGGSIVIRRS